MSIVAFVAVALVAAAACVPVRRRAGAASLLTCVAIAVVLIAAFALETGTTTMFAGAALRVSPYLRLLLVVGAGSLLLAAAVDATASVTLAPPRPESERRPDLQETLPGVVEGGPATVVAAGAHAGTTVGRARGETSSTPPGAEGGSRAAASTPRAARSTAWSSRAAARIGRFGSQAQLWGQSDGEASAGPVARGRDGRPDVDAGAGTASVRGVVAAARGMLGSAGTGAEALVSLDAWSARQARDMAVAGLVALAAIAAGLAAAEGAGPGGAADTLAADALAMQNGAGAALGVLVLAAAAIVVAPLAVLGVTPPSLPGLVTLSDLARYRTATRQVRVVALAAAAAIGAIAWSGTGRGTPAPDTTAAAACLALAAISLVLRLGPVPAHAVAARLGAGTPPGLVPAVAVWLPTGFALAVLAWSDHVPSLFVAPGEVRTGVAVLAALTLGVGAVAAAWQHDLARLYAYAVIADTGFAFLALAAAPSDLAVARTWLLVNASAKTALVAWSVAMRRAYGTAELSDLAGWARRAPILGAGLVAIAVATFGLPGWPVWDARLELARTAAGGLLGTVVLACAWLGLLPYARMALLGAETATRAVESGASERLVRVRSERVRNEPAAGGALAATVAHGGGGPSLVAPGAGRLAATTRPLVPESGTARTIRMARATWNANRTPAAAALVLAVSLVALAVASPAGSLRSAAGSGVAPLPSPPAVTVPPVSPGPSGVPGPTPRPTARPSAAPTASPKPTPARTARPTRRPLASPTAKPKATARPAAPASVKPAPSATPKPTPSSSAQA